MTLISASTLKRAVDAVGTIDSGTYPWEDVLQTTQDLIGADAGCFMAWNRRTGELQSFVQRGHDGSVEQEYVSHYYRIDRVAQNAQKLQAGQWLSSSSLMTRAEWEKEEFYADFLSRHRIGHIFGFALTNDADCFAAFAFQCHTENRELPRLVYERPIVALTNQMQRVYRRRCRAAARSIEAISAMTDASTETICLVASGCRLDHYSPQTGPHLSGRYRLRVRGNILEHTDPACNQQLISTTDAVLRDGLRRSIVLPESWGRVHRLSLCSIPGPLTTGAQPCALVRIEARDMFRKIPNELAIQLFRLTAAEARVLMLLFAGHDASECAVLLNVAVGTVRKQIASILQKTGCHRQSDLIRVCSMVFS